MYIEKVHSRARIGWHQYLDGHPGELLVLEIDAARALAREAHERVEPCPPSLDDARLDTATGSEASQWLLPAVRRRSGSFMNSRRRGARMRAHRLGRASSGAGGVGAAGVVARDINRGRR